MENDDLMCYFAKNGNLAGVKAMLLHAVPTFWGWGSRALCISSDYGHVEMVKVLLPYSDPTAWGSLAIRLAAYNGHLEIVKLLKDPINATN